jgi:hypothetical protein
LTSIWPEYGPAKIISAARDVRRNGALALGSRARIHPWQLSATLTGPAWRSQDRFALRICNVARTGSSGRKSPHVCISL